MSKLSVEVDEITKGLLLEFEQEIASAVEGTTSKIKDSVLPALETISNDKLPEIQKTVQALPGALAIAISPVTAEMRERLAPIEKLIQSQNEVFSKIADEKIVPVLHEILKKQLPEIQWTSENMRTQILESINQIKTVAVESFAAIEKQLQSQNEILQSIKAYQEKPWYTKIF